MLDSPETEQAIAAFLDMKSSPVRAGFDDTGSENIAERILPFPGRFTGGRAIADGPMRRRRIRTSPSYTLRQFFISVTARLVREQVTLS